MFVSPRFYAVTFGFLSYLGASSWLCLMSRVLISWKVAVFLLFYPQLNNYFLTFACSILNKLTHSEPYHRAFSEPYRVEYVFDC